MHTHLFTCARLTAESRFPVQPGLVRIVLRDDAEADAELFPGEAGGQLYLTVDAPYSGRSLRPRDAVTHRRVETDAAGAETDVVGTRTA